MKNKYIINWELSLNCNLNCSFCSQKERRKKQKEILNFDDIKNIIDNLPNNCHISFLWWEILVFPNIIKIFKLLEEKKISYEITTNWILLGNFVKEFDELRYLNQINISLDWFWKFHDVSRWKFWIFDIIIDNIWQISKNITISTVITNLTNENLIKLYIKLNELWISEHKIIYLMNFTKIDIENSKKKINSLYISSPWNIKIDNNYKNEFIKKILLLKKIEDKTKIIIEPEAIIKNSPISCKQIDKQFRINELWKISICEFINNDFWDLKKEKFENAIKNREYTELKEKIISNFPLDICKTCCKIYKKEKS